MIQETLINLEKIFTTSHIWGLGASFFAGFLVSFSPCIYPLIPITLGVTGAAACTSKLRGFTTSFVFVLGIASVYTLLGIASSVFGLFLATFFINPFTYFFLSAIFFVLGCSLTGIIKLNIPFFSINQEHSPKKGLISVFVLGAISGFAIIPCNFPVLGAILSLISLKKSVLYGGTALFLFSLGYGTTLIILGTFSSLIKRLPKGGKWLIVIHKIIGLLFLAIGSFFLFKFITLIR